MQRVTISIDEALGGIFDRLIEARGYTSRSEAVRDLVREAVDAWQEETSGQGSCVANLSYVYDRRVRAIAGRLSDSRHAHHDLVISTTQVHLDHDHTLETVVLRGSALAVRTFSDKVRAERGVQFAALNLVGVHLNDEHLDSHAHTHVGNAHLSPRLR